MNCTLQLFTQPDLLLNISRESLQKLLNHFAAPDPDLSLLDLSSPYFSSELARFFARTQSLSPHLRETLLRLESAASPENYERLSTLAETRIPCASEFHPLALALELWLASPDELSQLTSQHCTLAIIAWAILLCLVFYLEWLPK